MNNSTGTIRFEGVSSSTNRRNRLLVQGALASDGSFSSITSISGFQTQGSQLVTYNGDLNGMIGDYYSGDGSSDNLNDCYIQTVATPNCGTTAVLVGADDSEAITLSTGLSTLESNIGSFISSRLNFTAIDVTDTDLTD